jgi:hypothetical protein
MSEDEDVQWHPKLDRRSYLQKRASSRSGGVGTRQQRQQRTGMAFTDRLAGEEEVTWGELRHGLT